MNSRVWVLSGVVVAAGCSGDRNEPPEAAAIEATTDEDVAVELRVLDGAHDADGDPLRVVAVIAGEHVAEVIGGATIRVTPKLNFHGAFDLRYTLADGVHFVPATAAITVRPVNDAPIAAGRKIALHRVTDVALSGSDVDGDALTYEVVTPPAHGALTGTAPALRYTPELAFAGKDGIAFRVHDGSVASAVATIELDVTLGAPPTAMSGVASGLEDQPTAIPLTASDPDSDPIEYVITRPPAHGALSGTAPSLVYTPEPNFFGPDDFEFRVTDGALTSATATISIAVASVNDLPVALPQAVTLAEDGSLQITLAGTDVENSSLTFQVGTPLSGQLTGTGSVRTYVPNANFHGSDNFTFVVHDGVVNSAPATVSIAVTSVPDPPVATSQTKSLNEDQSLAFTLIGSDGDNDALTFQIASQPTNGTVTGTPPNVTYAPAANFHGNDSFSFTVSDGSTTTAPATLTLQVFSVNDPPVASDATVTTAEDTAITITLPFSDADGTTPFISIVGSPDEGTVSGSGATWIYTPAANSNGMRSFTFRASDGLATDDGKVTIHITPVNDPPTVADDFVATDPGTALTIDVLGNDFEFELDPFGLDSVGAAAHGTVTMVGDDIVYTPEAGFTGVDQFTYTAADSLGAGATATVRVGVGTFPTGAPRDIIGIVGTLVNTSFQFQPSISSDGRYVAFASQQALVPEDTNNRTDIYVLDRGTRTLSRASVAIGGGDANNSSFRPQISANGRFVVFDSSATDLVPGDSNARFDVFRFDRQTGTTVRVSVSSGGAQGSSDSTFATISDDGNLVAFGSTSFDLVADDANGHADVFVRDLAAGTTTRVSVSSSGGEADGASAEAAISGDGRHVAFSSVAINLVADDSNSVRDVFVRDRVAGTTTRVSVTSTGGQTNAESLSPSLSSNGRFVSFISDATNLVPGTTALDSLYVRDLQAVTTTVASTGTVLRGRLSGDGRYVFVHRSTGSFIRDRFGAQNHTPTGAATLAMGALSANGRYAAAIDTAGSGRCVAIPNPL